MAFGTVTSVWPECAREEEPREPMRTHLGGKASSKNNHLIYYSIAYAHSARPCCRGVVLFGLLLVVLFLSFVLSLSLSLWSSLSLLMLPVGVVVVRPVVVEFC